MLIFCNFLGKIKYYVSVKNCYGWRLNFNVKIGKRCKRWRYLKITSIKLFFTKLIVSFLELCDNTKNFEIAVNIINIITNLNEWVLAKISNLKKIWLYLSHYLCWLSLNKIPFYHRITLAAEIRDMYNLKCSKHREVVVNIS